MRSIDRYILVWVVVLLQGCMEYSSPYPIGKPKLQTNKSELIGKWRFVEGTYLAKSKSIGYGEHRMEIRPFNLYEYLICLVPDSIASPNDLMYFRAFETQMNSVKYANVSVLELVIAKPQYCIYRFNMKADSLFVFGVSDKTYDSLDLDIESERAHRRFIQSIEEHDAWEHQYVYVREKELLPKGQ